MFPTRVSLSLIFDSEEECILFLLDHHLIYPQPTCWRCKKPMARVQHTWQCCIRSCSNKKKQSIFHQSFFSKTKLPCHKIMELAYYWLAKVSATSTMMITGHSSHTVTDFFGYFNQVSYETFCICFIILTGCARPLLVLSLSTRNWLVVMVLLLKLMNPSLGRGSITEVMLLKGLGFLVALRGPLKEGPLL